MMITFTMKGCCNKFSTCFVEAWRWTVALAMIAMVFLPGTASACAFDMVKPERTPVDWIVESNNLVLARPKANQPFVFGVTRVLVGETELPPIDQLVDSVTRAKLAVDPSSTVLFAFQPEEGWRRVALVDESFQHVLQSALIHRLSWRSGMPQSRLDFIATLQESSDPAQKNIAIAELDKVPYKDLRELGVSIPTEELLADLWTLEGYKYQAIRALLLGLSGTPAARAEIHDYINRVKDWDWANNLGAFAAAYIELEGVSGVQYLAENTLFDPDQPLDKLEQIVMAMSVHHGLAASTLKTAIGDAIRELIDQRPETGVIVARQFSLRSDWSQGEVLQLLMNERAVPMEDLLTIAVYVARAREDETTKVRSTYD